MRARSRRVMISKNERANDKRPDADSGPLLSQSMNPLQSVDAMDAIY